MSNILCQSPRILDNFTKFSTAIINQSTILIVNHPAFGPDDEGVFQVNSQIVIGGLTLHGLQHKNDPLGPIGSYNILAQTQIRRSHKPPIRRQERMLGRRVERFLGEMTAWCLLCRLCGVGRTHRLQRDIQQIGVMVDEDMQHRFRLRCARLAVICRDLIPPP